MKRLDFIIQSLRIRKALPNIPLRSDILDIGCADGALFRMAGNHLRQGIGVDPGIAQEVVHQNFRLIPGTFPESIPIDLSFDVITMLAVFEHLEIESQANIVKAIPAHLRENGKVIMTIPSPQVDKILEWLKRIRLIDGMSLEEHHGFDVQQVHQIMGTDFTLSRFEKFQFGMNNLFVFTKTNSRVNKHQ
jgi:2-polyprenyl-3-methyl-5-hydroxy-6-metoxy-1,4-benzoquinol methylase